jgi:hypothetical protein
MNLPTASISPTRTAIDWLKIAYKDSNLPLKFYSKQDAKGYLKAHNGINPNVHIERVLFPFDVAWLIFSSNHSRYLAKDLLFHECKPLSECYYKERSKFIDDKRTIATTYYWDRESAIASIPEDMLDVRSDTVYSPTGSIVFGRIFQNIQDIPPLTPDDRPRL